MRVGWLGAAVLALVAGACSTATTATGATTPRTRETTATTSTTATSGKSSPTVTAVPPRPVLTTTVTPPASTTTLARPPAPPAAPPYPVGATSITLVDGSRPTISRGRMIAPSRTFTTLVWYPNAPGRWPLIVFAHGFQIGPLPYAQLLETWAAGGYVVAAPEFPLTDAAIAGPALDEADINNQPADVAFVAAALTTSGAVAARIDATRVGLAGHSDGAETVLVEGAEGGLAVRAVIALAVSPLPSGPVAATPPLLVGQGSSDTINPPALGQAVYEQAGRPRYLLHLLGAGHLPPFTGVAPWGSVVDRVTVDFLDRYVAGRGLSAGTIITDGTLAGVASMETSP